MDEDRSIVKPGLDVLPHEIMIAVCYYLDLKSIFALSASNRALRRIIGSFSGIVSWFPSIPPVKEGSEESLFTRISNHYRAVLREVESAAIDKISEYDYLDSLGLLLDHQKIASSLIARNKVAYFFFSDRVKDILPILRQFLELFGKLDTEQKRAFRLFCKLQEKELLSNYFPRMLGDIDEYAFFRRNKILVALSVENDFLNQDNFKEHVSDELKSDRLFMLNMVTKNYRLYEFGSSAVREDMSVRRAHASKRLADPYWLKRCLKTPY